MNCYDYIIADLRLRSDVDLVELGLRGFKPFVATTKSEDADCTISLLESLDAEEYIVKREISSCYVAESDADSRFYSTDKGYLYSMTLRSDIDSPILFHYDHANRHAKTNLSAESCDLSILRFGIWMMFGITLSENRAIAIHSSVIEYHGRGILFLGESGTGKSTHTRLWRESIAGAKLLNDDSPIVRIIDDNVKVFGSPWSGKTPCYKALSYPIAGFCRLSQAPHNEIRRLKGIAAIGALLPSAPPQYAHDEHLQSGILQTLGDILKSTPVYHLACLPNIEAAELSCKTIIGDEELTR